MSVCEYRFVFVCDTDMVTHSLSVLPVYEHFVWSFFSACSSYLMSGFHLMLIDWKWQILVLCIFCSS